MPKENPTSYGKLPELPAGSSPSVALYSFFRGAGLTPKDISDEHAVRILHRIGQLVRELVIGLTDAVRQRSDQKNRLRVPSTTIQPQFNNPLKFSTDIDDALNTLLSDPAPNYLSAVAATREAFQDIQIHQEALQAAMRIAVIDMIERFDPEELEKTFDSTMKRNTLIGAAIKLRYWDQYATAYAAMADREPGQVPKLFAGDLAQAYETEANRIEGEQQRNDSVQVRELSVPGSEVG